MGHVAVAGLADGGGAAKAGPVDEAWQDGGCILVWWSPGKHEQNGAPGAVDPSEVKGLLGRCGCPPALEFWLLMSLPAL